jgi:RHS repeat-associated protein
VTRQDGTTAGCHDYVPFGEEIPAGTGPRSACYGAADDVNQKFTGKERDSETGLDYFGARYFSGAQGRFTSPDWSERPETIPYASLNDPQTFGLYTYARNNPLVFRDPDGHCDVGGEHHWGWCIWHTLGFYQTKQEQAQAKKQAEEHDSEQQRMVQSNPEMFRTLAIVVGLATGMAAAIPAPEAAAAAGSEAATEDVLTGLADEAVDAVGPGQGPAYGTRVHAEFASRVDALGPNSGLATEVSYLNGQVVPYGTKGSVRLDVVAGETGRPVAVYDLKTGAAELTPARIQQIRQNLPQGCQNVPIQEIRPTK